jgi:aspartate/methionine/tyrosine aminotransferase
VAGVLVSPGEFYGEAGAGHVRIAVVQPDDRIELAARRLAQSSDPRFSDR